GGLSEPLKSRSMVRDDGPADTDAGSIRHGGRSRLTRNALFTSVVYTITGILSRAKSRDIARTRGRHERAERFLRGRTAPASSIGGLLSRVARPSTFQFAARFFRRSGRRQGNAQMGNSIACRSIG